MLCLSSLSGWKKSITDHRAFRGGLIPESTMPRPARRPATLAPFARMPVSSVTWSGHYRGPHADISGQLRGSAQPS